MEPFALAERDMVRGAELIVERWIEPVISEEPLAGRVGERPVLDRMPLGQAANNCYAALLL